MQAVRFFGPGDLRPQSVPTPELTRDGTVSVRVVAAGVCGSDLHNFTTGRWVAGLPVTPGHELAGIVTATRGACLGLRVGQPVVADSRVGCGQCEACEAGLPNRCRSLGFVGEVCDGGFAQTVVLPARQLVALPTDLPLHLAALAEPLSVALHAIGQLRPDPRAPVIVCGGGTIGGLAALVLGRRGHGVHLLERHPDRQTLLAAQAGTRPLPPDEAAWTERFGAIGPRFILDATGSAAVVTMALPRMAAGGTFVVAGLFHDPPTIDFNLVVERELTVRGVGAFAGEMPEAIALLPELAAALEPLITPGQPLDAVPALYAHLLAGGEARLKTLVAPNGTGTEGW